MVEGAVAAFADTPVSAREAFQRAFPRVVTCSATAAFPEPVLEEISSEHLFLPIQFLYLWQL
jgi:hypothetical protein